MKRLGRWASAGALAAPLLAFGVGPVLWLIVRGLGHPSADLGSVLAESRDAWVHTLRMSLGAAAWALVLGVPLGLLLFRTDLPLRRAWVAAFTLPSAIPPFILGMGWVFLANPKAGLLNQWFGAGTFNIYGEAGMAFVLGTAGLPLVLIGGGVALGRMDSAWEEAARVCGAGAVRVLATVTLPLALPAFLSGAILVFLMAASAFGVPYMLGISASPPTVVLTTRIYGEVLMGGAHLARAWTLSGALLLLTPLALALNGWLGRSARVRLAGGKGSSARPWALGRARVPALVAVSAVALALLGLPLAAIALTAVQAHYAAPITWSGLTLSHWSTVMASARTWQAFAWSGGLAGAAGALVCGVGLGVGLARRSFGWTGKLLEGLSVWPYAVPGTVLAMALITSFSRDLRWVVAERFALVFAVANTPWLLLIAYGVKHLALGERTLAEAVAQLDPSLAEAARISGATPSRAFRDVTAPLLRPAFAAAFLLTFLLCSTEITMSVLLVPPGRDVLGTLLFELQSYADPASAAVLACGLVILALAAQALLGLVRRSPAPG